MKEDVALGDTAFNRYTLGVYNDRRAYYAAIPTTATYILSIVGNDVQAYTFQGHTPVDPWDIKPARWAFLQDFLVGQEPVAALRQDPRYQFIETVSYDAPYGLNIQGQKASRLPQLLARLSG